MASKPLRLASPRLSKRITQDSPICFFPDTLLLEIFSWLDPQSLVRVGSVYSRWRLVALDRSLWRSVDLSLYQLSALALRKVVRVRLSRDLRELRLCGHARARSVTQRGASAKLRRALLTPALMHDLRERCIHLSSLRLSECDLRSVPLCHFPQRLQKLTLNTCMLSLCWFASANTLARVEDLDVSYCTMVNDEDLKNIAYHLPLLKVMGVRGCYRLSDKGIRALVEKRRGLKKIDIGELHCNGDLVVHHVCLFAVGVEYLDLSKCAVSDGSLSLIGNSLRNVKHLSLRGCSRITKNGVLSMLASLTSHGKISHVDLSDTGTSFSTDDLRGVLPEECTCLTS